MGFFNYRRDFIGLRHFYGAAIFFGDAEMFFQFIERLGELVGAKGGIILFVGAKLDGAEAADIHGQ